VQATTEVILKYTWWKCRFGEPGQRGNNATVRRGASDWRRRRTRGRQGI